MNSQQVHTNSKGNFIQKNGFNDFWIKAKDSPPPPTTQFLTLDMSIDWVPQPKALF